MAAVEALRHTVAEIIPFNRILAISIASAATDSAELVQPEAPERMNYVGTAHMFQEQGYNTKIELYL